MRDKNGKELLITRWIDEKDQLQIVRYFEFSVLNTRISPLFRSRNVEKLQFENTTSV